jgi:[ribosomal protein S5]-alanine N-acetyltransferase
MQINTRRLLLRDFRESDVAAIYAMDSRPDFQRFENENTFTEAEVRDRVVRTIQAIDEKPRTHYRLVVTIPPDDTAIGRVRLALNLEQANEWMIGWGIRPDYWGRGYATEAAQAMMEFGFKTLGVHRIIAMCVTENTASVRVMEKLNMQREARLRSTFWLHGAWQDEYVYGILDREFQ